VVTSYDGRRTSISYHRNKTSILYGKTLISNDENRTKILASRQVNMVIKKFWEAFLSFTPFHVLPLDKVKAEVALCFCLIEHHTTKAYGGLEIELHLFLVLALIIDKFPSEKQPLCPFDRRICGLQFRSEQCRGDKRLLS
jgi:hypothetical protein